MHNNLNRGLAAGFDGGFNNLLARQGGKMSLGDMVNNKNLQEAEADHAKQIAQENKAERERNMIAQSQTQADTGVNANAAAIDSDWSVVENVWHSFGSEVNRFRTSPAFRGMSIDPSKARTQLDQISTLIQQFNTKHPDAVNNRRIKYCQEQFSHYVQLVVNFGDVPNPNETYSDPNFPNPIGNEPFYRPW